MRPGNWIVNAESSKQERPKGTKKLVLCVLGIVPNPENKAILGYY